jgi:serine/threonine protein kinase
LINKELKFEDKYSIIEEEKYETYFQTYKIKIIDEKLPKEEFRSMIKIEKEIFGEFASDKKIAEEVSLLSKLDSRYLIKVYECFISNKRYYLITDYCEYGSLNEKLRNGNMYNESQIRYIILQIFKSVKYLNSNNFLHIEISPEKILIYNITKDSHGEELYNIKLLDFFFPSKNNLIFDNKSSFFCYMAPEVIEQKYSPTCDIWSIGIIIFQMFFGELPYKDNNDFKEYVKNIKSTYNNCDNISNEFKDLLDKMLNKNPSRRITIDECLSHPWVHKQNTEIITEDEEIIKQQHLLRTKTHRKGYDKSRKKSNKSGKITNTNIESKKFFYFSENNSYKSNLIDNPLQKNSSSITSDSISINIGKKNDNIINNKNDMNMTNESTKEKINIQSNNNIKNMYMSRKTNIILNINKSKKNLHLNLKRVSSISADKNNEKKEKIKCSPLIERIIEYIKYYININYHKKKEIEKITKIFHELDTQKNNYLLYNKVYFACASYKDNKKISLDSFNNYDINNVNNDKKYTKEEFINELIDEKSKYINDNLKNIFDIIKQPNVDEIIKICRNQELTEEYKKYINYIKEVIKVIKENNIKANYVYNEFKTILDNSIRKLYKDNISNKTLKLQNKERLGRAYTKKIIKDRNIKTKVPVKRSNTYLKGVNQENNFNQNNNINIVNKINLSGNNIGNFEMPVFNPENFLKLIKK